MKVEIQITQEMQEPRAVIYAKEVTEEVKQAVDRLSGEQTSPEVFTVRGEERYAVLHRILFSF